MKAGMKAEQQTGSRDLKQTRQTDKTDRQTTQQTRSCSQRQRDVGEGSNTLLLIPLLLCCEEPQFPFKWWTIPLMIAVKYTHANTHTHTRTHTHPHTHTHTAVPLCLTGNVVQSTTWRATVQLLQLTVLTHPRSHAKVQMKKAAFIARKSSSVTYMGHKCGPLSNFGAC